MRYLLLILLLVSTPAYALTGFSACCETGTGTTNRTLTITEPTNGTITGAQIDCGTGGDICSDTIADNTSYALTATADGSYTFTGWTGDLSGTTSPSNIVMSANRTVGATFSLPSYTLSLTITDGNSTDYMTVDGSNYTSSDTITGLNSASQALVGHPDTGREVACTGSAVSGSSPNYTVDMSDSNESANCTFSTSSGTTPVVEIAGTESDGDSLSTGAGTLTYNGTITHDTDHDGTANSAFRIASTSSGLSIQTSGNFDIEEGTYSFWYSPTSTVSADDRVYMQVEDYHDFMLVSTGTQWRFRGESGHAYSDFTNTPSPQLMDVGTWYYITFTWSLTTGDLTLTIDSTDSDFDGSTETLTDYYTSVGDNSANLYIGLSSTGWTLAGRIDTIKIYDEAL